MSNEFTRSYVGADGNSLRDSSYRITRATILPPIPESSKEPVDITRMIGFIRIHESLFNPSLFFEVGIRDDYNFLEEFDLNGDEIISLEIETKVYGLDAITHEYEINITKINDYARGDSQVHAYTLIGVSGHAFIAPLKKTNMVCSGEITKSIELLCNGIGITPVRKPDNAEAITKTHTVFGMKNPLKAALELLSVAVDRDGTPYFLYQTLSNNVYLASLSWINDRKENPVYKTFTYTDQQKSDPNSELEYFERSSQIVKLSSNIGISPTEQLVKGGGPRTLYDMDLNTKSAKLSLPNSIVNQALAPLGLGFLGTALKPYVKYRFTQPNANDNVSELPPISSLKAQYGDHLNAQIIAYDSISHQFSIMGDMFLNPGRTVHLQFPKTLDPARNPTRDIYDKKLSKDYLVFQSVHTFQEGKHTTEVTAKSNDY